MAEQDGTGRPPATGRRRLRARIAAAASGSMLARGLRARRRLHAALLAAAALTIAAAVVGGVFAGAAEESVVRDALADAPPAASGLALVGTLDGLSTEYPRSGITALLRHVPPDGRWPAYPHGTPVLQQTGSITLTPVLGALSTRFVWADGFCAHVVVVAGRCATGPHDAMVSQRTAAVAETSLIGRPLEAKPLTGTRIVGVYRPRTEDDPFWFGGNYFDGYYLGTGVGAIAVPGKTALDAVLVPEQAFLQSPGVDGVQVSVDYLIDPDGADVTGGGLEEQADEIRAAAAKGSFEERTSISAVIAGAQAQRRYLVEGSRFVALQLVVLGIVVLFALTLDVVEGRRREIALAKLRGQSTLAVARFALGEPLAVLVAALPVGIVAGVLAGYLLDLVLLRPGTPVGLPPAALGGAAVALAGAAVAVVLSTLRVLQRPILDQWNRVEHRREIPLLVSVPIALACLALAWGVRSLAARGGASASAIVLQPVLLIAAVAVLGVPVIARIARVVAPRTRGTDRYARFLAVRRLARERTVPRTATLLVVTLGLAAFAAGGESVLAGNRAARAAAELGAAAVVPVGYDGTVDPVLAVERADPGGRWAMAAATWSPNGGDTVTGLVVGLQSSRLARIGLPVRGGIAPSALGRALDPTSAPAVRVTGTRLIASLRSSALHGSVPSNVLVVVRDAQGAVQQEPAGPLRSGARDYTAAVPCSRGCDFLGFVWDRPVNATGTLSGTVLLTGLAQGTGGSTTPVDAHLDDGRAWVAAAPVSDVSDRVSLQPGGVQDVFRTASGYGGLQYRSTAAALPAVGTPGGLVTQEPPGGFAVTDELNDSQAIRPVGTTPLLPSILDGGAAVDLEALTQGLPDFANEASWQVWLSADAPADAVQRLTRAGLVTGTPVTLGDRETRYAREAPALSFGLLLALAVIAAVLAVLATAVTAASTARARAREAASMRMIGVPARAIVRASVLEQVLLLGTAAVLALPAGVAGVLLVMPQLREFATGTPVPLVFTPTVLSIASIAVVFVVAVAVMGAFGAATVVRAAGPQRLREVDL